MARKKTKPKDILPLKSVGTGINKKTGELYSMLRDGGYEIPDDEDELPDDKCITVVSDWFYALSDKDLITLKKVIKKNGLELYAAHRV